MTEQLYLGVDGGQSHTEAVVADERGNILGRGRGGASNHAEQPGGRERLRRAIVESVGSALSAASFSSIDEAEFAAAHCAMTGGAHFKEEIISGILRGRRLTVGHDAPAALAGATAGEPGVVVIAGTGSVAYGETAGAEGSEVKRLQIGGWGYLFGDEGSGFWIALEAISAAMRSDDGLEAPTILTALALDHFGVGDLQALAASVYRDEITRDLLAMFAPIVQQAAADGDAAARKITTKAGEFLAQLAATLTRRLGLHLTEKTRVAPVGGVFRGAAVQEVFKRQLGEELSQAQIIMPRFDPTIGALILAYREAELMSAHASRDELLTNLEKESNATS